MNALKCDRCGVYYDHYGDSGNYEEANCCQLGLKDDFYYKVKTFDLCPNCMKELKEFLRLENEK